MSDLSRWGGGIDRSDDTDEDDAGTQQRSYRNGRCPGLNTSDRNRCAAPVSRMNAADGFCGTHGRMSEPWTIHDDPEKLIILTGRLDTLDLDDLEPDDVDFDLERIRDAVQAVQEADR